MKDKNATKNSLFTIMTILSAQRAGADVHDPEDTLGTKFKYPSYVQVNLAQFQPKSFWIWTDLNFELSNIH